MRMKEKQQIEGRKMRLLMMMDGHWFQEKDDNFIVSTQCYSVAKTERAFVVTPERVQDLPNVALPNSCKMNS